MPKCFLTFTNILTLRWMQAQPEDQCLGQGHFGKQNFWLVDDILNHMNHSHVFKPMLTLLKKFSLQQLIERENASGFYFDFEYVLLYFETSRARGTYHGTVHLEPCLLSASSWILRMRSAWIWYKVFPLGSPTLYIPLGYWTPRRVPWPPAKSRTPTRFSEISSSPVIEGEKKS